MNFRVHLARFLVPTLITEVHAHVGVSEPGILGVKM